MIINILIPHTSKNPRFASQALSSLRPDTVSVYNDRFSHDPRPLARPSTTSPAHLQFPQPRSPARPLHHHQSPTDEMPAPSPMPDDAFFAALMEMEAGTPITAEQAQTRWARTVEGVEKPFRVVRRELGGMEKWTLFVQVVKVVAGLIIIYRFGVLGDVVPV
ncbi:hypothetical protein F4778DRAFT_735528 [Xylariomycetidae sp. FL2044]|nr:hypothetical protein F4778DRAFT_735528 [Xylariomycetidae sp. FL2044]